MSAKKLWSWLGILVIASMAVTSCVAPTPQVVEKVVVQTQVVEKQVVQTQVVEKEVEKIVTPTPVPPTAVPPTAAPQASDTVVLALQQEPDTLHPLIGSMMARTIVLYNALMPGCMTQNEKTEWIPLGCETVPTIDNGGAKLVGEGADQHLEVTYKIVKGWRWTDGTPVTAKDAIYWWKLQLEPEFEIADRSGIEKLYDVSAVDDSTILVKWMSENQAKAAAAGTLTGNVDFAKYKQDYIDSAYDQQAGPVVDPTYWNFIGWLPEHVLSKVAPKDQAASDYARKPLGDGPYEVKEWKAGQEIDLVASDKPFPLGAPKIKNVVFRFFADTSGVIAALQNGEIDVATGTAGLSPASAPDLDKIEAAGQYKVQWLPGYQWEHIDLNTTKAPLDDVKVRQALAYATDKQTLVDKLYFGKQQTTDLPLPRLSWAFTDNYNKYPFDLDKAKALLAEAGWDCKALPCNKKVTVDGKEVTKNLEITLMTTDRADRQALAQVLQSMWKKANIGVNIQFLYGRGLFATCSAGGPLSCRTFDAAIYTWISGDDATFNSLYRCQSVPAKDNGWSGQNYPGFCDKEADQLLSSSELDVNTSLSRDKRKPVIEKFFGIWTAQVPVIPLFANTTPYVGRVGLKGYKPGTTQYAPDAWNIWEWELSK